MSKFVKKGTTVCRKARKTPKGKGMSYGRACGTLLEDARVGPDAGWDVVDLRLKSGKESSAYSFDLRSSKKRKNTKKRR